MDHDYLQHYGVLGMKWGVRRTPAQLGHDTSKKNRRSLFLRKKTVTQPKTEEPEDVETRKQRILKSRSAKQLYDNADLFSTQELQTAYNRLQLERNIANLAPKDVSRGEKFIDGTIKWTRKASDLVNAGSNAYKSIDTVRKMFGDTNKSSVTDYLTKNISDMTDDELSKAVKRATSEKLLRNYRSNP